MKTNSGHSLSKEERYLYPLKKGLPRVNKGGGIDLWTEGKRFSISIGQSALLQ